MNHAIHRIGHVEIVAPYTLALRFADGTEQRIDFTSFDLSEAIHQFHQGPARELYLRYADRHPYMAVAFAIETGILDRTQVASDVLDDLARALSFYAAQRSAQ